MVVAFSLLPYDIIVCVCQEVRYNSLRDCCSLGSVNSTVRSAAIPFIFTRISFGWSRFSSDKHNLDKEPQNALKSSLRAIQVVRANLAICNAVREFRICSTDVYYSSQSIPTPVYETMFALPQLQSLRLDLRFDEYLGFTHILTSHVPSLRRLVLPDGRWVPILFYFPQVLEIEFEGHYITERDINILWGKIPNLLRLTRLRCYSQLSPSIVTTLQKLLPRLQSLEILGEVTNGTIFDIIPLFNNFTSLRHLQVQGPDLWNVGFFHPTERDGLEEHEWEEVHRKRDELIDSGLEAVSQNAMLVRSVTIGDNYSPGYCDFTLGPEGRFVEKKIFAT